MTDPEAITIQPEPPAKSLFRGVLEKRFGCYALLFLVFFLLYSFQVSAQRGDDFNRLLSPLRGRPPIEFKSQARFFATTSVRGTEHKLRFSHYETIGQLPLAGNRRQLWSVGFHLAALDIQTEASLPQTPAVPIPSELYDLEVNTTYRQILENGHLIALTAKAGSASDQPYHSMNESNIGMIGAWRVPASQNNAWLLFLSYANRNPALDLDHIPLLGVAYQWRLGGSNWAMLGIPASAVQTQLNSEVRLELFYVLTRNIQASITWDVLEHLALYTQFRWDSEKFWRKDREDHDHSLNFHHKKLAVGSEWSPNEQISIGLETGAAFDRFIYEAKKYSDRNDNRLDLGNGWYGCLRLDWRF